MAGDTLVKDVTQEEVEKVCRWNNEQLLSLIKSISVRQVCTFEEAPLSSSEAECKEAVDACVEDSEEDELDEEDDEDPCEDAVLPDLAAGCYGVTVADYEQCIKELARRTKQVFNEPSCKRPGEEPDYAAAAKDLPSQCEVIVTKCPSLLPDPLRPDDGSDF